MTRTPVCIVGGGAAGTFLALQLANRGIASLLFDRRAAFGRGVAYGATSPWHRLNVPIDKIGEPRLVDPVSFRLWHQTRHGAPAEGYAARFVTRRAYGDWLCERLDRVIADGLVRPQTDEIVAIETDGNGVALTSRDRQTWRARHAVLCLGNHKPRALHGIPAHRVVADIWEPGALESVIGSDPVLIVGTGATAIDAALELWHRGHRGTVTMVSRRTLMPLVDAPPRAHTLRFSPVAEAGRLTSLLRALRDEAAKAAAAGIDWQAVIDAFRLQLEAVWRALPTSERRRFHRHLRPYWMIHRHRLAPDIDALLKTAITDGRLTLLRGRLRSAEAASAGLHASLETPNGRCEVAVGWILNCTGPEEDFRRLDDPIIKDLLTSGRARPGAFGIGFDVDDDARLIALDGTVHPSLFVVGSATRSRFGEVTSAPQMRDRAAAVAVYIAANL